MAKIFPDVAKTKVIFASHAEETVYSKCLGLSSKWQVYYSVTLSSIEENRGLVDNETDFLLYHPDYGVVVLEVKGGRIGFNTEKDSFYTVNRYGKSFFIKNPFQQALTWKSRFLRYLRKENVKVPITHMVSFPSLYERDLPKTAEIEKELFIGKEKLENLEVSLKDAVKKAQPQKFLQFDDVANKLDKVVRGISFAGKYYLRDYIDNHNIRVKDLEHIQESILNPIAQVNKIAIEGEAGTGKTLLAALLAKHFHIKDKSVLILTTNPLLNTKLEEDLGGKIDVKTYAELSSEFGVELLRRPNGYKGSREDWIQFEGPETLKKEIEESDLRYDVVICDEAQDVQPFWWEAIEAVLKTKESNLYIFFDRSQGVFGSGEGNFVPEEVLPIKAPYFPLVNNYRTTSEINSFAQNFRTGKNILVGHSNRVGYLPQIITYKDEKDFEKKLKLLVSDLKEDGILNTEMTILSARRAFHDGSVMKSMNKDSELKLIDLGTRKNRKIPKAHEMAGGICVSTISSFKGLETPIGIITNLCEYNLPLTNPIMASLLYVAATRAKHMLYFLMKEGDPKLEILKKARESIENHGSLVIDQSVKFNDIVGEVVYYNPERAGMVKISSENYQSKNILIFPNDVELADIGEDISVGMKIRFRPRVEGNLTYASDIRLVTI